jgi:hypothetical protein
MFIQFTNPCRFGLVPAADLFTALRGRLNDSNKNLVMATLSTIGGLASAMGPSVEKSSKVCNQFYICFYMFLSTVLHL